MLKVRFYVITEQRIFVVKIIIIIFYYFHFYSQQKKVFLSHIYILLHK